MNRDGNRKSFWQDAQKEHHNAKPTVNDFETIIVGAGITGISLAIELQKRGQKCLVLEKNSIGFGTTGGTTAFINNFFDESYDSLISKFGEDKAQTVADHALQTVSIIKNHIERYGIDCDFEESSFYLFSAEKKQDKPLEKILEAHEKLNIETSATEEFPFDLIPRKVIEIKGQAQFHPLKYITALSDRFEADGGLLLTGTFVKGYERMNDTLKIETDDGEIFTAKHLVWATHIPPGNNRFNLLLAPYRSYALAAKIGYEPEGFPQAADIYDAYHYFRYHKKDGEYYLIVGGFDHKTGHEADSEQPFADLVQYTKHHFNITEISEQWSSQYYVPADGLPYIGKMPGEEHVYIATGYNGNGITWGTLASQVLADLIQNKDNELADIVSPSRIEIKASAASALKENSDAAFQMVKDQLLAGKSAELNEIANGEGKVIEFKGKKVAAYRNDEGNISFLSAVCPHMGCIVKFNTAEKSWDCPCHGSRFDLEGNVLNIPATTGLDKI